MGGFFHLVDLKQGRMARKIGTQKRNVGGLEAPRNSLELPVGTYQSYYTQQDGPDKYQATHDWSETVCYPVEAPMKKLISDEMSKRPKSRANSPSIVARLMGVETLPLDAKPVAHRADKKNENPVNDLSNEKLTRNSSVGSALSPSKSFRHFSLDSFHLDEDSDPDEWSGSTMSKKPMPREHPQEEELQKFKKEFEAWQSARFKECSKIVQHGTIPDQWMAQENLNKEKMALYANSGTKVEKFEGLKKCRTLKGGLHECNNSNEFLSPDEKQSFPMRRKTLSEDFEPSHLRSDYETGAYSAPTKIVILRPGYDNISNPEEPWASSSGASEERNNIEDFLEEVKERLKFELQGKTFKRGLVRGGGIETPYSERPSDPKQIAQRIAKQVRESVTKDLGTNLLRSESTRSYRNEYQCSGTSSPEFISRDTRRLLSERLRNVLKRESQDVENSSKSSILNRKLQSTDVFNDDTKDENDIQSKSFRCGTDDMILKRDSSPINLVRSLSAPVSGTSFGKLLLEDRHVITGAHIRRKHEATEKLAMKVKKQRKEKFNLRERVSSFKYSLTLRARLFGKKIHSATEFRDNDRNFVEDIMNGPTVTMNFVDRPDNSTEVPPSPASVCSSIHDDLYRAAYCASPTTPGGPTSDDSDLPQAFRDISSNLSELRKQLHQLETGRSEETVIEEKPFESDMVELEDEDEDEAEAYIRDLLITSGLYDNSFDKLTSWDTFAKPISSRVYEHVERLHRNKLNKEPSMDDHENVDHKVLFDLVNEVVLTVVAPPTYVSKYSRKAIGTFARPPHGSSSKLLDEVWGMLRSYLRPPVDKSFYFFDTMVGRDLQSMPWSELVNEDIDCLTKEVECEIIRDLMEETVKDMMS